MGNALLVLERAWRQSRRRRTKSWAAPRYDRSTSLRPSTSAFFTSGRFNVNYLRNICVCWSARGYTDATVYCHLLYDLFSKRCTVVEDRLLIQKTSPFNRLYTQLYLYRTPNLKRNQKLPPIAKGSSTRHVGAADDYHGAYVCVSLCLSACVCCMRMRLHLCALPACICLHSRAPERQHAHALLLCATCHINSHMLLPFLR